MDEKREESKEKDINLKKDEKEKSTTEKSRITGGRPTRADELSKIRDRTGSQGSITDYVRKRGKDEEKKIAEKAEKEILANFSKEKRVTRLPPNKIKREEKKKEGMETEKMLKDILAKMDVQERERKKDKEEIMKEIMKEIHELREDYRMREMLWGEQKASLENRIKQLEEKVEKMENSEGEKLVSSELMKKMKEMERNSELAERRKRKNNIIIKGMKVENGGERKEKMIP
ncbi:DNA ligase 1-like [Temnothorax curvispinosus]|uniref:DNA ligase 1-like n=1 Tax=Temnothorax curvispinosus TaxID=300111 RepID=A0A6J1QJB2_9HYME|nr:DNA ligase 1-like [Temnothorax curvispinosus]XP_024881251.1 DNA ligase 1-like [Temnothorax curvispinosus]